MVRGYLHPDFYEVAKVLERQLRGTRGGAAVCVYHQGEKVVDVWAGARDAEGTPWQEDTLAMSFSTTKGVVATALHVLVDQGLADYDDPVAKFWPSFGEAGKDAITIRHLLCHEAGMHRVRHALDHAERMLDWEYMVEVMEEGLPAYQPGTANGYHGLTYGWLVGELIQRISGRPLQDVIQKELVEPLGLDGASIGADPALRPRVAQLLQPWHGMPEAPKRLAGLAKTLGRALRLPIDAGHILDALVPRGMGELVFSERVLEVPIPALNGVFTARSLARLYAMLAAGGELDGVRVLSDQTVARLSEIQNRRIDLVVPFPMRWRLGYHLAATSRGILDRGFGHFGYGGSGAWGDPERQLAVALVVNRVAGTPFGDLRMLGVGRAAVRCAEARTRDAEIAPVEPLD